jgi:urease accessory protein
MSGATALHEFQRQAWFSPAFPVGGYAYSHGIEMAVATGDVRNAQTLAAWIGDLLSFGAGRNDAILLAEAYRAFDSPDPLERLTELAELGAALAQASERRLETLQQGASFIGLIHKAWPHPALPPADAIPELPYPVAVGMAGGAHQHPLEPLIAAYLQAFAGNLIAAGIRLSVIGQTEAQARLAGLIERIADLARVSLGMGLADLGSASFRSDLMAIRHETLEARLFRS